MTSVTAERKSVTAKIFKILKTMYTTNCTQCSNEFDSEKPAKFCSANCRIKFSRNNIGKTDKEILIEKLKDIQSRYKPHEITKAILTKETGIHYTFIPNWLMHGKVYGQI